MSKPKRKSGLINQNQRNNGQKTSQERVSELIQQQQDKKEAELLSEERVQKKLQELEEQRQANEKALVDQKESLSGPD